MKTYGNLALAGDQWVIHNLAPHVAIKLKAVFPGVPRPAAVVRFPATPQMAADLAWFCERYPLRASNDDLSALDAGRTALKASQAHAVVDPDLGVQSKNNDAAKLQKLVQRYLDKVEAGDAGTGA